MNLKAGSEKNLTQNANSRNKPKFCVKILRLLQESLRDEKKIPEIGLAWCEDGNHFICNSQILGNHLKLKSNSINTNFRAHSFQIENINFDDLQKMFGSLPDLKNWKMRRIINNYSFNYKTTESEADKIPCSEKTNRTLDLVSPASNTMLPQITKEMLKQDKIILNQIELVMSQVDFSLDWQKAFLNLISNDWYNIVNATSHSHNYESIHVSNLIKAIIDGSDPKLDQNILHFVEFNLGHLLKNSKCSSQSPDKVFFIEYLKLCLRYGTLSRIANVILELSSQTGFYFTSWFIPTTDQQYAIESMSRKGLNWILKLSKSHPNVFTILLSSQNEEIKSSHITFNPMPMKPENTLSGKKEESQILASRATFREFIIEVLNYEIPMDIQDNVEFRNVKHVSLNEIVNTDDHSKLGENESNISDFELIGQSQSSVSCSQSSGQSGEFYHFWDQDYLTKIPSQNSGMSNEISFSPNMSGGIITDLNCSQTSQGLV